MPRPKISSAKFKQLTKEWHEHNRWLKQCHLPKQTFDEYVDSVFGVNKISRKTDVKGRPKSPVYRAPENNYPSADIKKASPNATARRESKKYSGDLIAGIATMHKSNAVPVMKGTDEAKDISRMRR